MLLLRSKAYSCNYNNKKSKSNRNGNIQQQLHQEKTSGFEVVLAIITLSALWFKLKRWWFIFFLFKNVRLFIIYWRLIRERTPSWRLGVLTNGVARELRGVHLLKALQQQPKADPLRFPGLVAAAQTINVPRCLIKTLATALFAFIP